MSFLTCVEHEKLFQNQTLKEKFYGDIQRHLKMRICHKQSIL